jgi:hypothetical protein
MNREDVIREIVKRDIQGLQLSAKAVHLESEELFTAACDHFGAWDTALKYAGISTRRISSEDEYSPERVLSKIRERCHALSNLSAHHTQSRERRLYDAACRHFGSWRAALIAAGINPQNVRRQSKPRQLDKQQIIQALRQHDKAGLSLSWSKCCYENQKLASAAKYAFQGWRWALIAAGLNPEICVTPGGPPWDRQQVIQELQRRNQAGKTLNCMGVRKDDRVLYAAVHRYFGSWSEAVQMALREQRNTPDDAP